MQSCIVNVSNGYIHPIKQLNNLILFYPALPPSSRYDIYEILVKIRLLSRLLETGHKPADSFVIGRTDRAASPEPD